MEGRRMATQYCSTRQKARGLLAIGEWAGSHLDQENKGRGGVTLQDLICPLGRGGMGLTCRGSELTKSRSYIVVCVVGSAPRDAFDICSTKPDGTEPPEPLPPPCAPDGT